MAKKKNSKRPTEEVNSSSMADIAFLLLIFFLVTTTIVNEKGVRFVLPKKVENVVEDVKIPERNMLKILLNSSNKMLVAGQVVSIDDLRGKAKEFLNNRGKVETMSDSPEKAIISFKADRGSDFKTYLMVLDELKSSYHELRASFLNISTEEYLKLDPMDSEENAMLQQAKAEFPATLSEAEPNDFKQ